MRRIFTFFLILMVSACIDRLEYDIPSGNSYGISISGFITDQPGPYRVSINRTFDIDSEENIKTPVSVRHVVLFDDRGISEELREVSDGEYATNTSGIQGQVGRVYTLKIELLDGKTYESIPDTLLPAGKLDSVYFTFKSSPTEMGAISYGFDVFANASRGNNSSNRFMWTMTGTFKSDIDPELGELKRYGCNPQELGGKCNFYPICTGIKNIGPNILSRAIFERVGPCECCTCWYNVFNTKPILSDKSLTSSEHYYDLEMYHVPLNGWIFMHQFYVDIKQISLTKNAFHFWKTIRDQQEATGNIFQPVNGKIPNNFVQLSGDDSPVRGLFYAAGVSHKSIYIKRNDVPNSIPIPTVKKPNDVGSCLTLFPYATTVKPDYWTE